MIYTILFLLVAQSSLTVFSKPAVVSRDDYEAQSLRLKELVNDLKRAREIERGLDENQDVQFYSSDFGFREPLRKRDDLENLKVMELYNRRVNPQRASKSSSLHDLFKVSARKRNFEDSENELGATDEVRLPKVREADVRNKEFIGPKKNKYDFERELLAIMSSPRDLGVQESSRKDVVSSFDGADANDLESIEDNKREFGSNDGFLSSSGRDSFHHSLDNSREAFQGQKRKAFHSNLQHKRGKLNKHHLRKAKFSSAEDLGVRGQFRRAPATSDFTTNPNDPNVLQALGDLLPQQARNGPRRNLREQKKESGSTKGYIEEDEEEGRSARAFNDVAESNKSPSQAFDDYFAEDVKRSNQNGDFDRALFRKREDSLYASHKSDGRRMRRKA